MADWELPVATDGNPNWPPPDPPKPPAPTDPPSGSKALVWTILAAFWLWLLLPVAIYYNRRARREADESNGRYRWSDSVLHRPVLLWLIVFACTMALTLAMVAIGLYGDP
jgi:hypothetical protein